MVLEGVPFQMTLEDTVGIGDQPSLLGLSSDSENGTEPTALTIQLTEGRAVVESLTVHRGDALRIRNGNAAVQRIELRILPGSSGS